MTKDETLDLALEAIAGSGDFLFNWHDCEPNNEHEMSRYQEVLAMNEKAFTAIKQARALDKKAENARELGLDYEPAEVLGHNGWGFPIKAAAPVQEDWGPGPHECHSLTAAPVQDELAYRAAVSLATGLFKKHFAHEEHYASGRVVWEPCDTTAGVISQIDNMVCGLVQPAATVKESLTVQPAAPVQEPVAQYSDIVSDGGLDPRNKFDTTPPAAKRQWVDLTDEEIYALESATDTLEFPQTVKAIEAKLKELNT